MARKTIIPKRIGRVKIPKRLRKMGDRILADPRSREVASGVLLALGSALASRAAPKGSVVRDIFDHPVRTAKAAENAGADAAAKAGTAAGGVAGAASQLVAEVIEALRRDLGKRHQGNGDDDRMH